MNVNQIFCCLWAVILVRQILDLTDQQENSWLVMEKETGESLTFECLNNKDGSACYLYRY